MPSASPKLHWVALSMPEGSSKVEYALQEIQGNRVKQTHLRAEWYPRLRLWRAVRRVPARARWGSEALRPVYLAEFPCDHELRDFRLAEVMAFLESTYTLEESE